MASTGPSQTIRLPASERLAKFIPKMTLLFLNAGVSEVDVLPLVVLVQPAAREGDHLAVEVENRKDHAVAEHVVRVPFLGNPAQKRGF